ncbi:MAG: hypothetical protein QXO20_04615 [Candidatus Bathyarchaeia archaeon]
MKIVVPKFLHIGLPFGGGAAKNSIEVDGVKFDLGNDILLVCQILFKSGAGLEEAEGYVFDVGHEAGRWVRAILSGEWRKRAMAIGYWCDYLAIASREDPTKPEEEDDYIQAGFFATCTERRFPPFLYSSISKSAFYDGVPRILEDHIWLAGRGGGNFTFEEFEEFIGDLKKRYDNPVHLLYASSGVRKIASAYAIAVSAALTKHYGRKWRDFLEIAVFDRLIEEGSHPILKAILDGSKSLEEIGGL